MELRDSIESLCAGSNYPIFLTKLWPIFKKVLKKYDKTLDRKLKNAYIDANVKPAQPFQQSTQDRLSERLDRVERAYADIVTKGDVDTARRELRLHLREHVVWERNTVWREMIGIERKAQAANLGVRATMLGQESNSKNARLQGDSEGSAVKEVQLPIGRYTCPKFLISSTFWLLVLSIAIFAVLLAGLRCLWTSTEWMGVQRHEYLPSRTAS